MFLLAGGALFFLLLALDQTRPDDIQLLAL